MIPPASLLKPLSRVYKRETASDRAARVWDEYDRRRGYADYAGLCRKALRRESAALGEDLLNGRGFVHLNLLDPAAAQQLRARIEEEHELSLVKKRSKDLAGFRITDRAQMRAFLRTLITPAADAQFLNYFHSEYLVHTATFTVTPKAPEQASVSFRWHCDKGPRRHLKMIVYLNATAEHGGNSEFIDLDGTASVARHGYLFGWSRTRTGDIDRLSAIAGRQLRSHAQPMPAGGAVIFQPARVLHRGLSPTKGDRFVATLCLLPSPVHWEEALNRGTLTDLAESDKWHRHASDLLQRLDGQAT